MKKISFLFFLIFILTVPNVFSEVSILTNKSNIHICSEETMSVVFSHELPNQFFKFNLVNEDMGLNVKYPVFTQQATKKSIKALNFNVPCGLDNLSSSTDFLISVEDINSKKVYNFRTTLDVVTYDSINKSEASFSYENGELDFSYLFENNLPVREVFYISSEVDKNDIDFYEKSEEDFLRFYFEYIKEEKNLFEFSFSNDFNSKDVDLNQSIFYNTVDASTYESKKYQVLGNSKFFVHAKMDESFVILLNSLGFDADFKVVSKNFLDEEPMLLKATEKVTNGLSSLGRFTFVNRKGTTELFNITSNPSYVASEDSFILLNPERKGVKFVKVYESKDSLEYTKYGFDEFIPIKDGNKVEFVYKFMNSFYGPVFDKFVVEGDSIIKTNNVYNITFYHDFSWLKYLLWALLFLLIAVIIVLVIVFRKFVFFILKAVWKFIKKVFSSIKNFFLKLKAKLSKRRLKRVELKADKLEDKASKIKVRKARISKEEKIRVRENLILYDNIKDEPFLSRFFKSIGNGIKNVWKAFIKKLPIILIALLIVLAIFIVRDYRAYENEVFSSYSTLNESASSNREFFYITKFLDMDYKDGMIPVWFYHEKIDLLSSDLGFIYKKGSEFNFDVMTYFSDPDNEVLKAGFVFEKFIPFSKNYEGAVTLTNETVYDVDEFLDFYGTGFYFLKARVWDKNNESATSDGFYFIHHSEQKRNFFLKYISDRYDLYSERLFNSSKTS